LERRLATKGFPEDEREQVLATLRRTGLVDDERYASARASSLAERRAGNDLIRHDLERAGLAWEAVAAALESLEPEPVRVRRIVERRGLGPGVQRYLAGKGFSEDAIEAVLGESAAETGGGDCC
jgi:SOS response regulatory protein OraA/RecX